MLWALLGLARRHCTGYTHAGGPQGSLGRLARVRGDQVILVPPGSLWFLDTLRPPWEERGGADHIGLSLQRDATRGLGILEVVNGGEVTIGQDGIRQRPEMLCRLQFW